MGPEDQLARIEVAILYPVIFNSSHCRRLGVLAYWLRRGISFSGAEGGKVEGWGRKIERRKLFGFAGNLKEIKRSAIIKGMVKATVADISRIYWPFSEGTLSANTIRSPLSKEPVHRRGVRGILAGGLQ